MAVEKKKLFVGGLSWETTEESLKNHFSQFGEVTEAVVMKKNELEEGGGQPRGFGFVKFADEESVSKTLAVRQHTIDQKVVDPKLAKVKGQVQNSSEPHKPSKIFVGGLPIESSETDVKEFFSSYGAVSDVDLKYDKTTNIMRGFGFVTFENDDDAEKVVKLRYLNFNDKRIEAKRAEPRKATYRQGGAGAMGVGYNSQGYQQQQQQQQYMGYHQTPQSYGNYYQASAYPYGTGSYSSYNQTAPSSYGASNQPGVPPSQPSYPTNTPPSHSATARGSSMYNSGPLYQEQYGTSSYSCYQDPGSYKGQGTNSGYESYN